MASAIYVRRRGDNVGGNCSVSITTVVFVVGGFIHARCAVVLLADSETMCPIAAAVFTRLATAAVVVAGSAFVGLCEGVLTGGEFALAGDKSNAVVGLGLG
jgi:hypothetical protein